MPLTRYAVPLLLLVSSICASVPATAADDAFDWPGASPVQKPWAYWWWMGNAVDEANLDALLKQYADAGFGGLAIVPIYGVKGWEDQYVSYLSPEWMDLLAHTLSKADELGLRIDMSTGTGWPFGGPQVTPENAAERVVIDVHALSPGAENLKFEEEAVRALIAFSPEGEPLDLTAKLTEDGVLPWTPDEGTWDLYAVTARGTGQQVKRAAPGGEGLVNDPFSLVSLSAYLERFDTAFSGGKAAGIRSQYHDSFEYYGANWTDDFFQAFEERRGYDLRGELPALMDKADEARVARVRRDYRKTCAELHQAYIKVWDEWAEGYEFQTRNQAHGAPGNLLDLYGAADIPETEIFGASDFPIPGLRTDPDFPADHRDRPDPLAMKLSASAAGVMGKPRVACETATWLAEHFQVALSQVKPEIDQLFCNGINHIFYHGVAYSPEAAPWPGWLYYATTNFGPTNTFWPHLSALNEYLARCQVILQWGPAANDILLYYPIEDAWQNVGPSIEMPFTIHDLSWLDYGGLRDAAALLYDKGYTFDYVSDEMLADVAGGYGGCYAPGGVYRVVVVPDCAYMPPETVSHLKDMVAQGATVIVLGDSARLSPGLQNLGAAPLQLNEIPADAPGSLLVGDDLLALLDEAGIQREPIADHEGIQFIRRMQPEGHHYFIANMGAEPLDGWLPFGTIFRTAILMDPLTGGTGIAATAPGPGQQTFCYLQLAPGESIVVRTFAGRTLDGPDWAYKKPQQAIPLEGPWTITFTDGGPALPDPIETAELVSWTELGDERTRDFSGTARYECTFTLSEEELAEADAWTLDLGEVAESARVAVNGHDAGVAFSIPYRTSITEYLKSGENHLAIDVINLPANRLAALDRSGEEWIKTKATFVNINYKPFDASVWPPFASGLLGPVRLVAEEVFSPAPPLGAIESRGVRDLGQLAPGWSGQVIADISQSHPGWDVEIGDADNDGDNEVLFTGAPDSRLYLSEYNGEEWQTYLLANDLAQRGEPCSMGLTVKVVDLNHDGSNELIVGTGQEGQYVGNGNAFFYAGTVSEKVFHPLCSVQALLPSSGYTHNFGTCDLDRDGIDEVISAYCGSGEIVRYDLSQDLKTVEARTLYQNSGSGEDSFLVDVDNDGEVEYLTCDCYRPGEARVLIFKLDASGELITPPWQVMEGYGDRKCFNCSIEVGDVDNDGMNELVTMWRPGNLGEPNVGTLLGYEVGPEGAQVAYEFGMEDPDLDLGYGEKMMCIADADNDGKNDLLVTTRGERFWGGNGLGHVFLYNVNSDGSISKSMLFNFQPNAADAVWPAVGDADNDGRNEVVLAAGVGRRQKSGHAPLFIVERDAQD